MAHIGLANISHIHRLQRRLVAGISLGERAEPSQGLKTGGFRGSFGQLVLTMCDLKNDT